MILEPFEEVSDGSHGELSDSAVNELIDDSMPDKFPWKNESQANYLRQMGFSQ